MMPWGGLSCCLSAAALYLLGTINGRDAHSLQSVIRVNQLQELAQLVDAACKVLVVAVFGEVRSDTPIKCERSGLQGVIVEETAEQYFLKHGERGAWTKDSAIILSMSKEVPWYLDDGTDQVHVVGARGASGFALDVASETFEESVRSLVRRTLDYFQGLKMLGVKRIERVLPTGTPLTVVGEAVRDDIGNVRIQKPHQGPFYVSPKTIDQLVADLGKWARLYKFASIGLAVCGFCLIAKSVIQYILERRRLGDYRRSLPGLFRVIAAAAARKLGQNTAGSDELLENGPDGWRKDNGLCVICLEQEYNVVFLPCGHICCCETCSTHFTCCPLCRRRIEQLAKTFRP